MGRSSMELILLRLVLVAFLVPTLAHAAAQESCPPLGAMPDFVPAVSVLRRYDSMEFTRKLKDSDETETFEIAGRTCVTAYAQTEGKDPLSNLEIQLNYQQQLEKLGATIERMGGRDLDAHLVKDGVDTWLHVYSEETSIEVRTLQVVAPKSTLLPPSGNDYRLVGHLPDFVATKPVVRNFDKMAFNVIDGDGTKDIEAQGKTIRVDYSLKEGQPALSNVEIQYNYIEALRAQGAEILRSGGRDMTARLLRDGQVVWIMIVADQTSVAVSALEEKAFEPSIKPAQQELRGALDKAGHVALYVNFDFDKATLRPEAAGVVGQVSAMLKADPQLRLGIEGHTDGLGTPDRNRALSGERATAFVAALTAAGIAADRLQPAGFGPDKPIASNDTSEGRARNRRVELVKL